MKTKSSILSKKLLSIRSCYMSSFVELFMGVKKEVISEVTVSDFLTFIKNHENFRGGRVAMFRKVISLIKRELDASRNRADASLVLRLYPHAA
ncbi:hypothetical protein K8Q96_00380 [Candidatus Nomurabacteria bacterium]|nr:hypothetical protein [Candidatus Nomurabacteria bacterium]